MERRTLLHGTIYLPYAPEPDWDDRGLLSILGAKFEFGRGVTGHLLWEWHVNGAWPAAQEGDAHFIRWQISYDRK